MVAFARVGENVLSDPWYNYRRWWHLICPSFSSFDRATRFIRLILTLERSEGTLSPLPPTDSRGIPKSRLNREQHQDECPLISFISSLHIAKEQSFQREETAQCGCPVKYHSNKTRRASVGAQYGNWKCQTTRNRMSKCARGVFSIGSARSLGRSSVHFHPLINICNFMQVSVCL